MFNVKRNLIVKTRNWWAGKFPLMACEEMGELIQVISKAERLPEDQWHGDRPQKWREPYVKIIEKDNPVRENLVEELADVFICVKVLASRYGITDEEIQEQLDKKLSIEKRF